MISLRHRRSYVLVLLAAAGLATLRAQAPEPPTFHIGVDAVRIDAVVTDENGNVVTDLTADDFELKDDGRVQKVTLATFVPVVTSSETQQRADPGAPPVGARPLARGEVQRSIVILADDLGLSWQTVLPTRKALHKFIDENLQPTDLVALTRTGMHVGMQRQFTTDKRLLHAAVDELRWTALSRRGVDPFERIAGTGLMNVGGGPGDRPTTDLAGDADLSGVKEIISALATLSATNLTVRAMTSLPGRKAIVLVSEGFRMHEGLAMEPRIQAALEALWDQAARAGVVVYSLDARGLQTGMLTAADNTSKLGGSSAVIGAGGSLHDDLRLTEDSLDLVSRETGGFAVMDTNDLTGGLRRILNDIRGFYMIGYTPDRDTFVKKGATVRGHTITVKVKRRGLTVRVRQGFIGRPESVAPVATESPRQALFTTAMSPFAETTMPVKLTPLWSYSAADGASVKALLHLASGNLTFVPGDDGRTVATAELVGVVVGADGEVVSARNATVTIARQPGDSRTSGVTYSLVVPVPRPGGYQLRFAVRDTHSSAVGSVGEFVEIPDVRKGVFALSSVALGEPVPVGATDDGAGIDGDSAPGVRQFSPGDDLVYTYEVYNGDGAVETSPSVWRDGKQVFKTPSDSLAAPGANATQRAMGGLHLDASLAPGDYVLQIDARTGTQKKKPSLASTRVDFRVK